MFPFLIDREELENGLEFHGTKAMAMPIAANRRYGVPTPPLTATRGNPAWKTRHSRHPLPNKQAPPYCCGQAMVLADCEAKVMGQRNSVMTLGRTRARVSRSEPPWSGSVLVGVSASRPKESQEFRSARGAVRGRFAQSGLRNVPYGTCCFRWAVETGKINVRG